MYTEDYNKRGFPFRDFLLKLILVIVFVFLLCLLLPRFIAPKINSNANGVNGKGCTTEKCTSNNTGVNALTSQIFADNLDRMKEAAIKYYTDERLPKEVGQSDKMTLSDMIGKKIIVALIDKNNKACDVEKSYVKITKADDEYILKVNLKDSEKEDYILVHLGCYTYCNSYICQKQGGATPVKGAKDSTTYVPIKGSKQETIYYIPKETTVVVEKTVCGYRNGNYYDKYGNVVSKSEYKKSCGVPEDKHVCVKYDGKYYDDKGNVVSKADYEKACKEEDKHYCVKYNGKYYDDKGNVVSKDEYIKACTEDTKHYCVKYKGNYYDDKGNVVSKTEYEIACGKEDKHYCVKYDGKYYDKDGNIVSEEEYKISCGKEDKHYCVKYNGKYYGSNGTVVSYETYKKQCESKKEYEYEYQKSFAAKLSNWTAWSDWTKTNCATQEINCNEADANCLKKLQRYDRKEKIGTYDKAYTKTRQEIRQTGSYTQKACAKYNYVVINSVTYATTTTTKYTQTNTITSTTQSSVGGWTYVGRQKFSNPPRDTATTHYKFVGADFSYCSDTCTTLPNYWYDVYTYTGGLTSTKTITTPGDTTSTTTSTTTVIPTTETQASCSQYTYKTIPIYSTVTVTDKAVRREPLYGTVCYQSTKTRYVISSAYTSKKWSYYNNKTLLNDGWSYTGNKRVK